jgi:hypothetical protein
MAEENGKPKIEAEELASSAEFVPTTTLIKRELADWGPWTDEDEEWFEIMTKEFGGSPERDPDL